MKNWFARLFGGSIRSEPALPYVPSASTPPDAAIPSATFDLDLAFFHWACGGFVDAGEAAGPLILDELSRLTRQSAAAAELVPRVPAVIPQLLRSLRDEDISGATLARQVAQDVTLVAEIIREANSPYYGASTPVANIEGALMLLGQNGLRMLLARVAFRPVINAQSGRLARQVAPQLWNQSGRCAMAASLLAPGLGADPFQAYLAGLTQNVGLIVAFRVADQVSATASLPRNDEFVTMLMDTGRTLSARIALQWELPAPVGQAIGPAGAVPETPLAQALHHGDQLSKIRILLDAGVAGVPELVAGLPAAHMRIVKTILAKGA